MRLGQGLARWSHSLRQQTYDWYHNVETWPPIAADKLQVDSESRKHGLHYDPESPSRFRRIMRSMPVRLDQFTFVDLGCGKARAILLASMYPFRKIIGVEYSAQLAAIAEQNLTTYRPQNEQKCSDLSVLCMDAAQYKLPAGPLVVYMYNPFKAEVMGRVLNEMKRAFEADVPELYVAYSVPTLNHLLKQSDFLVPVEETPTFCTFKAQHRSGSQN